MSEWTTRLRPVGVAMWNLLLALLLASLFILVLMTASAQSGVAERLARLKTPIDYSAAYPLWLKWQETEQEIEKRRETVRMLTDRIEKAVASEKWHSDRSWLTLAPIYAVHSVFSAVPECKLDPMDTRPSEVAKTLSRLELCAPEANVTPRQRAYALEVVGKREKIIANSSRWIAADDALKALQRQRDDQERQLKALEATLAELNGVNDSFGEISVLQRSRSSAALIAFPPSMTQIFLAFVSGMFGSLLLTLVLIVYPKSDLKLSETGKGYGPRILLGGLISLCVFVVIGGGTAVLGTGNAFADGEANYLAFCAFGILAGMFSDRVAAWLSERADTFFKLSAHQAAAKAEGAAERAAAEADAAAQHRDRALAARDHEAAALESRGGN